jgi:hypothetical protein
MCILNYVQCACTLEFSIQNSKTTKLILLDSLLQEIGDACLPPPACEVDQADNFR